MQVVDKVRRRFHLMNVESEMNRSNGHINIPNKRD